MGEDQALPSISTLLGLAFLAYIGHSIYQISQLVLHIIPGGPATPLTGIVFVPHQESHCHRGAGSVQGQAEHDFEVDVPLRTRRNLHVVLALEGEPLEWRSLRRDGPTVVHTMSLTDYMVPRAEAFKLLGDSEKDAEGHVQDKEKKKASTPDVPAPTSDRIFTSPYSLISFPFRKRMSHLKWRTNTFNTRLKDLVPVTRNTTEFTFSFHYKPVGVGKLRLMLLMEHATQALLTIGFATKEIDELKGIFSDTNVYLLCGTIFMSSILVVMFFGLPVAPVAPVVIMLKILSPSRKKGLA
ncbi:GM11605 [Drosophila sechellia]|uniref:Lipid scramblase CLPTM1L n=1 Tax=Drosophila sechellia TaxID=7238 RepID=B4IGN2_DROSE|nr:GM11605 [Drosophila sechellia]